MSPSSGRAARHRISRDVVLQAGLEALSAHGFHGASMRTIATAAGTSLSNLYNYFPSKEFLLAQVLLDTGSDLLRRLEAARAAAGRAAPAEVLDALVTAYVDFIVERPEASVVGISEIRYLEGQARAEVTAVRDRSEALFTELIQTGCRAGEFATPFPRDAARAVVSVCASLSGWFRPGGALDRDAIVQRHCGFARGIVGA